ncbi:MAG: hypothetical protein ABR558_09415 [Thioalkalivibrio sp.]
MNSLKFQLSLLALFIAQGLGLQTLSRVLVDGYLVDRPDSRARKRTRYVFWCSVW